MRNLFLGLCGLTLSLCLFYTAKAQSKQQGSGTLIALPLALNIISQQYKVNFLYEETVLTAKLAALNAADIKGQKLKDILTNILTPLNLTYYPVDAENYSIFPVKMAEHDSKAALRIQPASAKDSTTKNKISGKVLNELRQPQQFATLSLIRYPDSVIVSNVLSDTSGTYTFNTLKKGVYMVRATSIGYNAAYSGKVEVSSDELVVLQPIVMSVLPHTLKTVQVRASRPMVETKSDRFILNVENSAMALGNSIQLLKSAPFVQVSPDNTVTLQGKKTMILIDNKPMPDAALENILKTLPAGNISKIELITHPSAKYDAAYGAVINITTKKSQIEGLTGNVRIDGSQGIYAEGTLNGSLTYKHQGLTLYSSASITKGDNLFKVTSERVFSTAALTHVLTNDWRRLSHNNLYSFQLGGELVLNKNQTLGALINPNIYRFSGPWTTVNAFNQQGLPVDSVLATNASFHQKAATGNYNINYHLLSDSGRNDLTALVTYTPFSRNLNQTFPSVLTDAADNVIRVPPTYQTVNTANINVWIGQLDYTHLFKKQWKVETGIKYQTTYSKAAVDYNTASNGMLARVPNYFSNNSLTENIAGGYGILTKNWKADQLQFGLRLENTNASLTGFFRQNYFNPFPTLLYQHNLSAENNLSFTFKRTISRAPYYELVPYTVFNNQYTIEQGNPALRPEFDNIYSLNANIHKLSLSLSYTDAKGLIGLFPINQDNLTGVTYFSRRNLDHSSDLSLYLYYPLRLTSWWETENSGTVAGFNSARGQVLGTGYTLSAFHSDFKSAQIFRFSKQLKLEIDAYYWTPYVQDLSRQSGYKNVDASLLISFWNNKGQFRIGGSQIVFKRNDYLIIRDYGSYSSRERISTDSKRITAGFTYNFGKTKIKSPDKKLGNEDAVKRL